MNWQDIKVSEENKYFVFEEKPIFNKIFIEVLKFHSPGFAPVTDETGAYHIDTNGNELYPNRYSRTFGFYCNRASVIENNHWFHINEKGERVYSNSFLWAGNFQEKICTVRDFNNNYYHIDIKGSKIYNKKYRYAGDFKDGFAVVKLESGLCKHIDKQGNDLNNKLFVDLGVFHKSFATAKDKIGWFHINKNGSELYKERFLAIEPFYNGFALATKFDSNKIVIDEYGRKIIDI